MTIGHLMVGIGLTIIRFPMPVKLAAWFVLSLSLSRSLLRQRSLPTAITLHADGHMRLIGPDGARIDCRILPDTTVMPWLVVLRYRTTEKASGSMVLPVDALGAEAHRQLRAWLRWRANVDQV